MFSIESPKMKPRFRAIPKMLSRGPKSQQKTMDVAKPRPWTFEIQLAKGSAFRALPTRERHGEVTLEKSQRQSLFR